MTNSILLVNPRRKRRRKSATRVRRRRSSARVSRRRRRNPIGAYMMNPRRRRHRSRRRNPRGLSLGGVSPGSILKQLIPAATGAAGAVGLDIALAYVPIPEQYKAGWLGTGVKVVGAIVLGMLGGKVFGKQKGQLFTAGALTVIAYSVVSKLAKDTLGDKVKGLSGVADFTDVNLGAYMRPALPAPARVGAYMPAPMLQGYAMDGFSGANSGFDDY